MNRLFEKIRNKFSYAFQGLVYGLKNDLSIQIQYGFAAAALIACFLFRFELQETAIVLAFCAIVISLEYFNSALERMLDDAHPDYSGEIKIIKDLTAGAVLVASIIALAVGLSFIIRHII